MRRSIAIGLVAVLAGCTAPTIYAWADETAESGGRIGRIEGSPFGDVAPVRVNNMNEVASMPGLDSNTAFEVAPSRSIVGRWLVPANSAPIAVSGDRMLIQADPPIWIAADGSVHLGHATRFPEAEVATECRIPAEFAKSEYAVCRSFVDLETQAKRFIAFEAACS